MQKILALSLTALLLCANLLAAVEYPDQSLHRSCGYCGMDRVKFAHSRMLIEYSDGSSIATCSLHCAAVEFAVSIDKTPAKVLVGDFNSQQLLDAEQAVWVVGGEKAGVMTARAKWAFADKTTAEQFVTDHGGRLADFDQAMKAAYEDMYQDSMMIRNKRKMKKMQMQSQQQDKE